MTRDEILAMEAGHELNVLVAGVLGYQVFERYGYYYIATNEDAFEQGMKHGLFISNITSVPGIEIELCQRLRCYSTDDASAWDMLKQRFAVNHFVEVRMYGGAFECAIDFDKVNRDTLAHAASLAALLAVMEAE